MDTAIWVQILDEILNKESKTLNIETKPLNKTFKQRKQTIKKIQAMKKQKTNKLNLFERFRKGFEGYYYVRGELETGQNCNILTPTLLAITAFLSSSPELLNRRHRGPASAGTWFSFQHLLSNSSELPVARVDNNLTSTYFLRASQFRTQFNPSTVKVAPDLLISLTGCNCNLDRCNSYFDSLAGSEVNMQHFFFVSDFKKV